MRFSVYFNRAGDIFSVYPVSPGYIKIDFSRTISEFVSNIRDRFYQT
jgi:hypothetical protein